MVSEHYLHVSIDFSSHVLSEECKYKCEYIAVKPSYISEICNVFRVSLTCIIIRTIYIACILLKSTLEVPFASHLKGFPSWWSSIWKTSTHYNVCALKGSKKYNQMMNIWTLGPPGSLSRLSFLEIIWAAPFKQFHSNKYTLN